MRLGEGATALTGRPARGAADELAAALEQREERVAMSEQSGSKGGTGKGKSLGERIRAAKAKHSQELDAIAARLTEFEASAPKVYNAADRHVAGLKSDLAEMDEDLRGLGDNQGPE
jgi:cytochrome c556